MERLKMIRDEIGICICEDCKFYKYQSEKRKRFCKMNRNSAVSSNECPMFINAHPAGGLQGRHK